MNMGQDRQMQMVGVHAEGNAAGHNGNQIRCYNCRGVGHFARNYTIRPRKRGVAYLQTQLLIAQKEEAGIQLQDEEFDLMAAAANLDEIEEVNANYILMANLQQVSTSGTQTDKASVYDSDGSTEYTELLEPIPESHQVPQNDNDVISEVTSMKQSGETVEHHPANVEETRALYDSFYHNLPIEVEKVNTVNRKLKETNVELTTELARFKNQEKCFEISQEKYDKLKRYLNKQLSKEKSTVSFLLEEKKKLKSDFKIRKDELLDKQIQLEKRIKELDNILVKTGQSIQMIHMLSPKPDSFYHTEQKMALGFQIPFYLKQAQKKQQSLYDGKVLLEKHDPPVMHDSEETLQLAQESRLKKKQLNKEIKQANYRKINHLSGVFRFLKRPSHVKSYIFQILPKRPMFLNQFQYQMKNFWMTLYQVLHVILNEVKSTIVTLQRVVKHRMTFKTHNLSSSAHQESHKIVKDENFPIVNQVGARVQYFEIQFLKKAAKFVGDFKSLAKEADASLAKKKALELEIEHLLKAVVSQDIMSVVKNNSVVDTSNLQTELERTKERFKDCINKKENEYAKLWNDWYKKCEECKFDKISYDKATDNKRGTSMNTKFAKQSILGKPPKLGETHALSKPVTSNSITTPQELKVVKNDNVIALGMFRINPFKTSREEKHVPKNVRASVRTQPIIVS
nr:hypothetical protein [Tanacetum cinerariifolium]